jgi:putative cardiolipin synthase
MRCLLLSSLSLLLCACSSLPQQVERPYSQVLPDTSDSTLGKTFASSLAAHPGLSRLTPLSNGNDAYLARRALAHDAERTLDLQYYTFHADHSGFALLNSLLDAADRGVRVRLLLDDIHLKGSDAALAALDDHPQIEVRLFNPFANRSFRLFEYATDFNRINRRMHNKSMTADGQLSIVGGRNIGDEYFNVQVSVNFSDMDLLVAGPAVKDVEKVFDNYWNSAVAYPIQSLHREQSDANTLAQLRVKLANYVVVEDPAKLKAVVNSDAYWGKAEVIADDPLKITLPPEDTSTYAITKLLGYLAEAKQELILVSPYFVPGKDGVKLLSDAVKNGVRVRVLTNSFAATDVRAVHAGYSRYRKDLLRAGVELYEMKSVIPVEQQTDKHFGVSSGKASLHAKVYMMDQRYLFVGSINLDPRSARLNTEMGVVLDSAALCEKLRTGFDRALLEDAYKVELQSVNNASDELVWITIENGKEIRIESEPDMGPIQSMTQFLMRILPVEAQL